MVIMDSHNLIEQYNEPTSLGLGRYQRTREIIIIIIEPGPHLWLEHYDNIINNGNYAKVCVSLLPQKMGLFPNASLL